MQAKPNHGFEKFVLCCITFFHDLPTLGLSQDILGKCRKQFPFQFPIHSSIQQVFRCVAAICQQQAETPFSTELHKRYGLHLYTVIKHAGQFFDFGEDEMSRSEINPEIRSIGYFTTTTPIRNFDGLIPVEDNMLTGFKPFYKTQF